jgi:hypothetical protein
MISASERATGKQALYHAADGAVADLTLFAFIPGRTLSPPRMDTVRCYYFHGDHIVGFEVLSDASDDDMIKEAEDKFRKVSNPYYDGVEVWRRNRCLYRSPARQQAEVRSSMSI